MTRVAAIYDVHGNLPALEAVLRDVRQASIDHVVVGGDVLPGPMPRETLELLQELDCPTHFVCGNGDLAVLAQMPGAQAGGVAYWGTTSGARPPDSIVEIFRWSAAELGPRWEPILGSWPKTFELAIGGLGRVLFCHSTPRSETEGFTRLTPEQLLLPIYQPFDADLFVGGHTHMQFDRRVGTKRVINAGSVGAPFGEPGAYWLLLGPEVEFRRTGYDYPRAAERIRATTYPDPENFANGILSPPSEQSMLEAFAQVELRP